MRVRNATSWVAVVLWGLPAPGVSAIAAEREIPLGSLITAGRWQAGGTRVNYTLGQTRLGLSTLSPPEGPARSLRLLADFTEPQRAYASAYHLGPAIPGECRQIRFRADGDGSGCTLRLSIEDAAGRWFETDITRVNWNGWRRIIVAVGTGDGWRPLVRRGSVRQPMRHPVNLRQIALIRNGPTPHSPSLGLADLRATVVADPVDYVRATLQTGHRANLLDRGATARATVVIDSDAAAPVAGKLTAVVTDFYGLSQTFSLGAVVLAPRERVRKRLVLPSDRTGAYQVAMVLTVGKRVRAWRARYGVSAPIGEANEDSMFGCCGNTEGFREEDMATVLRLNSDAGIKWARLGIPWQQINPSRDEWVWTGPSRVAGVAGKGAAFHGEGMAVPAIPALDCPDAVTIAFWARAKEGQEGWQFPLAKAGAGPRNYGVYFHKDTGDFCFTASYSKTPAAPWTDFDSGVSAWDGMWHHYAATYSAADKTIALYVDGVGRLVRAHDGGPLLTNKEPVVVGRDCHAEIDEMVLYRRALTVAEIASLAGKATPPVESLLAWWSFDNDGHTIPNRAGTGFGALRRDEPAAIVVARASRAKGIKTLGILGFPPRWASTAPPGSPRFSAAKPDLAAWSAYVENVVRQYRDVIQHWEIWNEPNIDPFWVGGAPPQDYFEVLKAAYLAAKRGNPACKVMMPGLAGPGEGRWGMDFLEALLVLGASRYCDAISIHPYRQAAPEDSDLVGDLRRIEKLAQDNGGRRPIWFTENCWTTELPYGSDEDRQARMLGRGYALALSTGHVERFIWFRLHDSGPDRFYSEDNYGLCYDDLTPKPAYFAHRTVASLLHGAKPDAEWRLGDRASGACFRTPKGRVAAVWCPTGEAAVAIFVGRPRVTIVDLMGNASTRRTREGVLVLTASENVVFLRGLPEAAAGLGPALTVKPILVPAGARAPIAISVLNPYPDAGDISVRLRSLSTRITIQPTAARQRVSGRSSASVTANITVAPGTPPGQYAIAANMLLDGRPVSDTFSIGVRSAPSNAGPVALWEMDERTGITCADRSRSGNALAIGGGRWADGAKGGALRFDGTAPATAAAAKSLDLRDEVTVALRIRLDADTGTWQFPLTKFLNGNTRRNYGIYIQPKTLFPAFSATFERSSGPHVDIVADKPLSVGTWHHVAATYSMHTGRVRLYVDGALSADQAVPDGAMLPVRAPLAVGTGMIGAVDDVIVYPRALSQAEIANLAR